MLPATSQRVPLNTADQINRRIREQTEDRVARLRNASPGAINRQLADLDREWDIERCLEANAATACLVGVALGTVVDRRWFALPAIVGGFLLQHALQGWCPPVPVFRRFGFRTEREIDVERFALKALRGDFRDLTPEKESAPPVATLMQAIDR